MVDFNFWKKIDTRSDQRVQTNKSITDAWRYIDGNSNACPIRHRLQDIHKWNLHDPDDLDFNVESGPVSDINMPIGQIYVLDFTAAVMSLVTIVWNIHNKNIHDLELTVKKSEGQL